MKSLGIILAGGTGSRLGGEIPKQFIKINNKEILLYSLEVFINNKIDEIIMVSNEKYVYMVKNLVQKYENVKVVIGGKERLYSVYNAIKNNDKYDVVLIHDAARPLLSDNLMKKILKEIKNKDITSLVPGVKIKDTIRDLSLLNNNKTSVINRNNLINIQTPQAFKSDIIKKAYNKLFEKSETEIDKFKITDDAMVVEIMLNISPTIIDGEYSNIKITTNEDLMFAEFYLKNSLQKK